MTHLELQFFTFWLLLTDFLLFFLVMGVAGLNKAGLNNKEKENE